MARFNFSKRINYSTPHRAKYRSAGQRRADFWRAARLVMATACVVLAALALLGLLPGSEPGAGNLLSPPAQVTKQDLDPNPLADKKLYVDPDSNAGRQADEWRLDQPNKALLMDKLADQPSSRWFSNEITFDDVHGYVAAARDADALPVTVAYFLPKRDCSKYSTGGAPSEAAYYDYIDTYAKAIGTMDAVVILEPDALVHTRSTNPQGQPCLNEAEQQMYFTLLSYAVDRFTSLPAALVYIDAGNSGWTTNSTEMADLLKEAGVEKADGFSLNISNFQDTASTVAFGDAISDKTGGEHYLIDTSRNGLGVFNNNINPDYNWCNPPGRAMGHYPTTTTGVPKVDAYLYIKNIGESDGTDPDTNKCFGGPPAGTWWPEYALGLVERWPAALQYKYKP